MEPILMLVTTHSTSFTAELSPDDTLYTNAELGPLTENSRRVEDDPETGPFPGDEEYTPPFYVTSIGEFIQKEGTVTFSIQAR